MYMLTYFKCILLLPQGDYGIKYRLLIAKLYNGLEIPSELSTHF